MGDYAHKMEYLMDTRAGRYWKRKVIALPPAELAELEEVRASTRGSLECQRERFWRAILRVEEPDIDVPWNECDKTGSKSLEQIIGVRSDTDASNHRESQRKSETVARTREFKVRNR